MATKQKEHFKYPGIKCAMDGNSAVIMCERESTDAAGAYPITPSTQMGEHWAEETAKGHVNISNRPLIFIEPEGEHAAAAVTAGLSMTGLRAANFSSGQGIAYMHESLYAAVGKRLTYILNMGCRAMTKATLNVHAGHDDYHCIDDTGFFQIFGKNAQEVCDLNIIAHKIAELSLTPGVVAQDGFLTTHLIESLMLPERELIKEYLGRPEDIIDTPTPAQRLLYGDTRRRIPELWTVDNPVMAGLVQNQDAYMQSVAAQRPFFFDHIQEITDRCFEEFYQLTGREYHRVSTYSADDADYLIVGQGSLIPSAEAVIDYIRQTRGVKVGIVNMTMFRPFPGDLLSYILSGKKAVTILERIDQPLAEDLPLTREVRAVITKSLENGNAGKKPYPFPQYATYTSMKQMPRIYTGSFGLGSRDLQPRDIIGAIENMLPDGEHRKMFYLSIEFIRKKASTPKQELYQQTIEDAYPRVKELAVCGSENPNLMPDNSITVRFHSVGGWGAITTGKNLAMTLFDLLDYHIKANPKYGSEKKGQPTTYYLSAAPEPIGINCEYFHVDVVLSPDPHVFQHTNALAGLNKGGVFIIQSDLGDPDAVWASFPERYQRMLIDKQIRVFFIDAFKIAREEATDPDLQFRMQGIAFQGSFFAASDLLRTTDLTEERLFKAIRNQLQSKFGSKGARVVEDNLRVVKRGYDQIQEVAVKSVVRNSASVRTSVEPALPVMLKREPQSQAPIADIHRFWEQTGNFYVRGFGNDNLTDPFIGLGVMPAVTGVFRDMTGIRFEHPEWDPQKCTGCGDCWTVCPDTAIPGLVNDVSEIVNTTVGQLKAKGHSLKHLPKWAKIMENRLHGLFKEAALDASVKDLMTQAITQTVADSDLDGEDRQLLENEFGLFSDEINGFKLALTRPFFQVPEKKNQNSGGLLSITVNPYTCKGCMECVQVCDDDALKMVPQTPESVNTLQEHWETWLKLPNTQEKYLRIDNLEEGIGTLKNLLLDKNNYLSLASGDGACLGCTQKTVIHLFTATVEALMQPRIMKHIAKLDALIEQLQRHIKLKLIDQLDIDDAPTIEKILDGFQNAELTLSGISQRLEELKGSQPIDQDWFRFVTRLLAQLTDLKWKYETGVSGKGRSKMGVLNATGCTSVWGSTYPYNPYPFPWANHLFQDSASLAMGVFEGHMVKMAEGFKAIRLVELELKNEYNPAVHDEFFTYFTWRHFTDEEFKLCPPVTAVGGDGAMYDIGFQNLSRAMMSGFPIKVLILDTQVYSNTGGQACTSGFPGQISDMAQYGKVYQGKQEIRKEIGLIAMAHRTTYVLQSNIATASHLIEGFIEGLLAKLPAVFNIYSACQPEHGIGDEMGYHQAKLALESRAYPTFRYNPAKGATPAECFDLTGNPEIDQKWPSYTLNYTEGDRKKSMKLPMTFADFAVTETRFRKHFKTAPPDTWNDSMVLLADFLERDENEREDCFPYIWTVDRKNRLSRLLVAKPMIDACEERQQFWTMLKGLAGLDKKIDQEALVQSIRAEIIQKLSAGLLEMAGGPPGVSPQPKAGPAPVAKESSKDSGDYIAPWIETEFCTSCDDCIILNPKIFGYNENKKATIKDPAGGPYSDFVRAAEKCTAEIIHPGLPADRSAPDIQKWIKRGEKYN